MADGFDTVVEDGVAVVTFDLPGESVNTLSPSVMVGFTRVLDAIERDKSVQAVVLRSGKADQFIAGAKLEMLAQLRTVEAGEALSREAQGVFARVERFPKPLLAAIHGPCLGGGLELVLACQYRLCSDSPKTRFALPEVELGLIPGGGGTQRLPRLVGLQTALDLLLTGRKLKAGKARRTGLVDEVVPLPILEEVARLRARELADGTLARATDAKPPWGKERLAQLALEENPLGRKFVYETARKRLLRKTRGKYPAPERLLEVVRKGMERGAEDGYAAEARAFGELVVSDVSRRLVELFFATTALKRDRGTREPDVLPLPVRKVGVLGSGLMGSGIAYVTIAHAGLPVRVKDTELVVAARALKQSRDLLDDRVRKKSLSRREAEATFARLTVGTTLAGFRHADVVVEAVFEDLELKRRVLTEVEAVTGDRCVFASNTSSLPISRLAEASRRPEAVVGMHYFSPVHRMPLLEVVTHPAAADWAVATAVELGRMQGKTVIVVRDSPGFYTSRILGAFLNEVAHLLQEGAEIEGLDAAIEAFGFPVGPFQLLDEVGIDVAAKVSHILHDAFGERLVPPATLSRMREQGRLGRKSGHGFYRYDGKRKRLDPDLYAAVGLSVRRLRLDRQEMVERMVLQMVNEAIRCLGEGVLRSARDGDVGAIFGLGFPAYLGGPFRYADTTGTRQLLERMRFWEQRLGLRFEPAPLLVDQAQSGKQFHKLN